MGANRPPPNLIGQSFGRLRVLEKRDGGSRESPIRWLCICKCGEQTIVLTVNLQNGSTSSCGCYRREHSSAMRKTHGMAGTRTFRIWTCMMTRCHNKNQSEWKRYGGRGITVCRRWRKFANFLSDMGEAPDTLTLGRIDNDGNYRPSNCEWQDRFTQANNTRSNIFVEAFGERLTLAQWGRKLGIPHPTLWYRMNAGYPPEAILATVKRQKYESGWLP